MFWILAVNEKMAYNLDTVYQWWMVCHSCCHRCRVCSDHHLEVDCWSLSMMRRLKSPSLMVRCASLYPDRRTSTFHCVGSCIQTGTGGLVKRNGRFWGILIHAPKISGVPQDRYLDEERLVETSKSLWDGNAHTLYVQYDLGTHSFVNFWIN